MTRLVGMLASTPGLSVESAGQRMLEVLSGGRLSPEQFLDEPQALVAPDRGVPRYIAQVVWRALSGGFRTVDEVVSCLRGALDRNPPVLEPSDESDPDLVTIADARVLRVQPHSGRSEAVFEVWATAGELRHTELVIRVSESVNPVTFGTVCLLWIHASVALYNLVPVSDGTLEAGPRSFFVLEPLRQVNATAIARSLLCPKPELDRMRRGRGDTTVHTLRGTVIHALLERLISEEENDLEGAYSEVRSNVLMQLASVVDDDFSDEVFEADVKRHARKLAGILDAHPYMRADPQAEVHRYSPTIGIQGRIDAVFSGTDRLEIVELKTGKRLRPEDHAQLYIYRLLLSDLVRRTRRHEGRDIVVGAHLISSHDGSAVPARSGVRFFQILDTRNRLVAFLHSLGSPRPHLVLPFDGYDEGVCGSCPRWTRARCSEDTRLFGDRPGSPTTAGLDYYRRLSALVREEGWWESEALGMLLDDSRLSERVGEFRTIRGARCTGTDGDVFLFEFDENPSELTSGDRVLIHQGEVGARESYHGFVRSVHPDSIRIVVPLNRLGRDAFGSGAGWIIDRLRTDPTSGASQTALFDFLCSPADARKAVVLGDLSGEHPKDSPRSPRSGLNASQREAVARAAACDVFHLIWGPPGTGKTRVIPEILAAAGEDVLLGAFTNTALDNMLMALLERDPNAEFLRIGRSEASPELAKRLGERATYCFSEDLARRVSTARELRARLDAIPVVAATSHRASTHPYLRQRRFGLTVVDEAGQLTEPLTLGLLLRARRFVLIGDDRQLPPVVRTPELGMSLFERLKRQSESEMPGSVTLLDVQYRMHPEIMGLSNRLYYEGRLRSGVTAAQRRPPDGAPVTFVPVDSHAMDSHKDGRSNTAEAEAIDTIVRGLLPNLPAGSIGVISPFRAQAALLRQRLAGTGITVDTVERFQGGERDVVIISFVRSRESGFVFDDRRLNVAITRARRKLILVAHPDLFRETRLAGLSGS